MIAKIRMSASQKTQAQVLMKSPAMVPAPSLMSSGLETTTCGPSPRAALVGSKTVNTELPPTVLPAESLVGKRALVTGSSRGIGADTAQYLASAGARVAINYRNKEARALKVVAAIEERGGEAIAVGARPDRSGVGGDDVRGRARRPGAASTSSS